MDHLPVHVIQELIIPNIDNPIDIIAFCDALKGVEDIGDGIRYAAHKIATDIMTTFEAQVKYREGFHTQTITMELNSAISLRMHVYHGFRERDDIDIHYLGTTMADACPGNVEDLTKRIYGVLRSRNQDNERTKRWKAYLRGCGPSRRAPLRLPKAACGLEFR